MYLQDIKEYDKNYLITSFYLDSVVYRIYCSKSYFKQNGKDQYFMKIMKINVNEDMECVGYIYFYVNFLSKESSFIGEYINPDFRNKHFASLLLSLYIKMSLDSDITNLDTNKKQRKPFLLYMLKRYLYEIEDVSKYRSNNTIFICKKDDDDTKYLYFMDDVRQKSFLSSSIFSSDNYEILSILSHDTRVLNQVLLSYPYYLTDNDYAYVKSRLTIDKFKK